MSHPLWVRGLKYVIETPLACTCVAPLVGAWIEIGGEKIYPAAEWSHPLWVRGLKSATSWKSLRDYVAPLVGAWIEITTLNRLASLSTVAPLVGAWIEIIT